MKEEEFFKELIQITMFVMLYTLIKENKLNAEKLNNAIKSEDVRDGIKELTKQFKEMEKENNELRQTIKRRKSEKQH